MMELILISHGDLIERKMHLVYLTVLEICLVCLNLIPNS